MYRLTSSGLLETCKYMAENQIDEFCYEEGIKEVCELYRQSLCESDCEENEKCFFCDYIDTLEEKMYQAFDMRKETYEKDIRRIYSHLCKHKNTITILPLFLITRALLGRTENYSLLLQQKINERGIDNGKIAVMESEFVDTMFNLSLIELYPVEKLEKYGSSMYMQSLLHGVELKKRTGQTNDDSVLIDLEKSCRNKWTMLFPETLNFAYERPQFFNHHTSVCKLNDCLKSDCERIISENGSIWFYGKAPVRLCIDAYITYIDGIMRMSDKRLIDIMNLMNFTLKIYRKYHHKLSAVLINWLVAVLKTDGVSRYGQDLTNIVNLELKKRRLETITTKACNLSSDSGVACMVCADSIRHLMTSKFVRCSNGMHHGCQPSFVGCKEGYGSNRSEMDNDRIEWQFDSRQNKALLESFKVLKNGTIRVMLKSKGSYMDEYASNHNLLKYNESQNDIEGMKYNLVYAMLLVEGAEKVMHKPNVDKDSPTYVDAERARSFALNDIKTYLPIIRKHDKSFDLNRFYNKVKADRYTIEIDAPATISGAKKIAQAILV